MSANHLPRLSQLIHMATPDLVEVEKAMLREQFVTASTALVTEARCLLDDKEELWEEKVLWMHWWEKRTGEGYPIVEHGQALGVNMRINAVDGPIMAEADEAYKRWATEEVAMAVHGGVDKDVQMGGEAMQEVGPVQKWSWQMVMESKDEAETPKVMVLLGSIHHKEPCMRAVRNPQQLEGRQRWVLWLVWGQQLVVQTLRAPKAGSSKKVANDDDNDNVEVVESHSHIKGKAPVHGGLNSKVTADLLQAEAAESQDIYLCLQVHIDQLAEVLEKIGVE
ncbi:hypothetical protein F5J12DRAFT_787127 [Pisolithus orientalis]|uniref:uncharacterized protein n=1 Tax=Pisolithus orientalis TaxID=936130 RepID=UPI002224B1B5|nr:uncharacterized protein F5J12DRAFT_787127 [Pisolithus orientalis]KAI5987139.1 hypothetical protein F5J12DRAFT_787127 [Pisolithus orientalis]